MISQVSFVICCNWPQILKVGRICLCSCKITTFLCWSKLQNTPIIKCNWGLSWYQFIVAPHSASSLSSFKKIAWTAACLIEIRLCIWILCLKYQQFHYSVGSGINTFESLPVGQGNLGRDCLPQVPSYGCWGDCLSKACQSMHMQRSCSRGLSYGLNRTWINITESMLSLNTMVVNSKTKIAFGLYYLEAW